MLCKKCNTSGATPPSNPSVLAICGAYRQRMDMKKIRTICASAAICGALAKGQTTGSILHVEFENATAYFRGYCSLADQGKNPNKLSRPAPAPAFPMGV